MDECQAIGNAGYQDNQYGPCTWTAGPPTLASLQPCFSQRVKQSSGPRRQILCSVSLLDHTWVPGLMACPCGPRPVSRGLYWPLPWVQPLKGGSCHQGRTDPRAAGMMATWGSLWGMLGGWSLHSRVCAVLLGGGWGWGTVVRKGWWAAAWPWGWAGCL